MNSVSKKNEDARVIEDFGREWAAYSNSRPSQEEHRRLFDAYFSIFPFDTLAKDAEGFDAGCGSGRWAAFVAERVGKLHCIDAASDALDAARTTLAGKQGVVFHHASIADMPLEDASQDFGYSLGVLHHIPDTARALGDCVVKLKPGAPFLVYIYYRFDDRPGWFVALWRISDFLRRIICRLPFPVKRAVTDLIAVLVYWPIVNGAKLAERLGADVGEAPLRSYHEADFRTIRNDALDRFGTRLEQRFTRQEITDMMETAGLRDIFFREEEPFWVALGTRE